MGAVHFSIDKELVRFFKNRLPLSTFVETGTYKGDSLARVRPFFDHLYSVESSRRFFDEALGRFSGDSAVDIRFGDSVEWLARLSTSFEGESTLFWLDAHWCVDEGTAGETSQCPLLGELSAIGALHPESVVLVDDFRYFLSPPNAPHDISHWPALEEVLAALGSLSRVHALMVFNDVGVFYPGFLGNEMREHARCHGVDWLRIADKSREYDEVLHQAREKDQALCEKEQEIVRLARAIDQIKNDHLQEKSGYTGEIHRLSAIADERAGVIGRLNTQLSEALAICRMAREAEAERTQALNDLTSTHAADMKRAEERLSAQEIRITELVDRNAALNRIIADQGEIIGQYRRRRFFYRAMQWGKRRREAAESFFQRFRWRVRDFFQPRLGSLQQYPPRPLAIPDWYHRIPASMSWPVVTLVTPSFQQSEFLQRTLESVRSQSYPALEYVIQDGGSTDDTVNILRRYEGFLHRWKSERDEGQTNAINRGFEKTTGEIMAWLNSDDMLLPGAIHYVADYFRRHADVDALYGHRILVDEEDREIGRWVLPPHDRRALTWADFVPQETLFWRRRIWEQVGGRLDERFQFAMDWDLLLRFQDTGAKIVRVPRFLGAFRVHSRQKTSSDLTGTGWREMKQLRRRCHGREVDDGEIGPNLRRYYFSHFLLTKLFRAGVLQY